MQTACWSSTLRAGKGDLGARPAHLPRIEQAVEPDSTDCPCGCGAMARIGEVRIERLDLAPAQLGRRDDATATPRCPSPRALARLPTLARDQPTRAKAIIVAAVEREVPAVLAARDAVDAFHRLLRSRKVDDLDPWIGAALASPVASFARGVVSDRHAVAAAIALPWSNGETDGNICKRTMLKRQMDGRATLDLLRARVLPVA